jgi:hypothetical protein
MPIQNIGSDVIEAYLKGVALKQQKEERLRQFEIQQQANEIRQKQLDQNLAIANQKFTDLRTWRGLQAKNFQSQEAARNANAAVQDFEAKLKWNEGIASGKIRPAQEGIQPDPNDPSTYRPATPQELQQITAQGKVTEQRALIPGKIEEAGGIEQAKVPARSVVAGIQSDLQLRNQREAREFQAKENELNRQNRLAVAEARRKAGIEENEIYDEAHIDAIAHGDMTRQGIAQLPVKDRARILGKATAQQIIPLADEDVKRFSEVRDLKTYINLSRQFKDLLKNYSTVAQAWTDPKVRDLGNTIDSLAKTFAVNIAGDRSILSEKEVPRISKGVVQLNPSGWLVVNPWSDSTKINNEINERRLNEFIDVYKLRIRERLGQRSQKQKDAINEKFNFTLADDDVEEVK